jgi:hypothetical protein
MMQENLVRDRRIQKQQLQIPTTPYPQIPTTPHQHVPTTHSQIFLLPHNHRFLLPHNNRILLPTIADSYNPHPQIPTTPQPQIPITQQQQQQSHQEIPWAEVPQASAASPTTTYTTAKTGILLQIARAIISDRQLDR